MTVALLFFAGLFWLVFCPGLVAGQARRRAPGRGRVVLGTGRLGPVTGATLPCCKGRAGAALSRRPVRGGLDARRGRATLVVWCGRSAWLAFLTGLRLFLPGGRGGRLAASRRCAAIPR